jgi:uncharacterized protein YjbI with pentapeptide repeats
MSAATVSAVLNSPDVVKDPTRANVESAITDLGYVRNGASADLAGFATWLFEPGIDLTNTDLSGANLRGVNLSGAKLTDAKLFGVNLSSVT